MKSKRSMSHEGSIWCCRRRIPSDTAAGRQVLDELLAQLERYQWSERDVFGVHLAVEEALVNAIRHGNRCDPQKFVEVVTEVSPDQVRIEITDEGAGFNPADVPDPTLEENLENPSGRGLMLMRNFMTHVEFNERGNRVVMEKIRSE